MISLGSLILFAVGMTHAAIVGICRLIRERQAIAAWERSNCPNAGRDIGEILTSFHQPLIPRRRRRRPQRDLDNPSAVSEPSAKR